MNEQLTFSRQRHIWRVQGDISNGDLSTLVLEAFWEEIWVTPDGAVVNTIRATEPVRLAIANTEPEIQASFRNIQAQCAVLISEATL